MDAPEPFLFLPCPSCSQPNAAAAPVCRWCGHDLRVAPSPLAVAVTRTPVDWNLADAYRLSPMSVLQVLDGAFKMYRDNFWLFLAIMSVAYAPLALAGMAFSWVVLSQTDASGQPSAAVVGPFCGLMVVIVLIHSVAVPIATGAVTRAVSDRYLSRPATVRTSYRAVWRSFFWFLVTMLLANFVVGFGILGCCVGYPGLLSIFGFVCQIAILERTMGTTAMGRSLRLSDGHRLRIFGLACAMLVVFLVCGWTSSFTCRFALMPLIPSEWTRILLEQGVGQVLQMLLQPLWSVAWVLMYYDVRIRKEAFDIELLLARDGAKAAA